ncbi:MAG: endolytic transglycosylase MltG [Patescibacteria group bacterium]
MKKRYILLAVVVLAWMFSRALFGVPSSVPKNPAEFFVIERGLGVKQIAQRLEDGGYIKSVTGFQVYVWRHRLGGRLQAGEYRLPEKAKLSEIARILSQGVGTVTDREVTIIEGWTKEEIADYLEKEGVATRAEFLKIISSSASFAREFEFLSDQPAKVGMPTGQAGLEGYLFPDTYRIPKGASARDVVVKMLENFDRKFTPDLRAEVRRQGKTVFDIARMASIIEAEVPYTKDRPVVSDILWKRLKVGMALQVDSSVNYVTGRGSRALSSAELETDSPYNTYKHKGFPPTPIGNPGLDAIRAAISPIPSPYWYFLSDKQGNTIFSKTYEDHLTAKRKYL